MSNNNEQPFVDHWPMWDEPLSKIPAGVDIDRARERLARKFNVRPQATKPPRDGIAHQREGR
jgi:hypothetical protein